MVMFIFLFLAAGLAVTQAAEAPKAYENCNMDLCSGKDDGNYAIKNAANYFVQCANKVPHCQPCWPQSLVFKEECNQCLYNIKDKCQSTSSWAPVPTRAESSCPDVCPSKGPVYKGNIADPDDKRHYVACWNGVTVGCVDCPGALMFSEEQQACLFDGKYVTKPLV